MFIYTRLGATTSGSPLEGRLAAPETVDLVRKIIARLATSADGFIARPDGGVDWLNERRRPKHLYGMREFYRSIDTILWGRRTYDLAMEFQQRGVKHAAFDPNVKNYAFSRTPPAQHPETVEFVEEPLKAFVRRLRAARGRDIWMMGGGSIIGSFLDAEAIDEFSLNVVPVIIGEGIPLIAPAHRHVPLRLLSTHRFADGVVNLRYAVR